MIENFSSGYYIKSYWIEKSHQKFGIINKSEYNKIKEYKNINKPITFKLGSSHFTVKGNRNVPINTLIAPNKAIEKTDLTMLPDTHNVLLKKNTGITIFQ